MLVVCEDEEACAVCVEAVTPYTVCVDIDTLAQANEVQVPAPRDREEDKALVAASGVAVQIVQVVCEDDEVLMATFLDCVVDGEASVEYGAQ